MLIERVERQNYQHVELVTRDLTTAKMAATKMRDRGGGGGGGEKALKVRLQFFEVSFISHPQRSASSSGDAGVTGYMSRMSSRPPLI